MTNSSANADQIEFWNEVQGDKWVRLQERTDTVLGPFAQDAISALGLRAGMHVLDIGCGCGTTSLAIAEAIGTDGSVTGVDISRPMIAWARERAKAMPAHQIEIIEADAQFHHFASHSFDAVFSSCGVMFFADPVAAFANILSAAKPGASMALAAWRDKAENPWVTEVVRAAKPHVELPPPPGPTDPGQFAFADEARVLSILRDAGWVDAAATPTDHDLHLGCSIDDAIGFMTQMGPTAQPLKEADDAVRERVYADLRGYLEPYDNGNGPVMPAAGWVYTAQAPE